MNEIRPSMISKDVMTNYRNVMAIGNTKLKQCAKLAGMKQREFRAALFRARMKPENMNLSPKVVMALNQALPDIKAVKEIEESLFNGVVRIAKKLANRISNWGALEYDDAEQEAYAAVVDAIYAYTKVEIKFSTVVWLVVNRRLVAAHNRHASLSAPTRLVVYLMSAYEQKKQQMLTKGPVTSEQVIASMGVSEDDRIAILDYLSATGTVTGGSIAGIDDSAFVACNDYTGFRKGIDKERDRISEDCEVRDAMEHAHLTAQEREIVLASLNPHYGWMTELAAATINPKTQKPLSKRAIGLILDRALAKIRKVYEFAERKAG